MPWASPEASALSVRRFDTLATNAAEKCRLSFGGQASEGMLSALNRMVLQARSARHNESTQQ